MSQAHTASAPTIELLAPAGDLTCLHAAVENGADAVYFGLDRGFNARERATNFCLDNLAEVMQTLRRRRVKGYVTLNTLVFSAELSSFEAVVRSVAQAGVDAVLVQDLGAAELIRHICPDLSIHASTQMTLTSAECIAAVKGLGIERVVLPRELSLREIAAVAEQTDVPLEVFVHGALCVAYSGQCLTSESLGGRSANRGQCAQACRLPYELYCDGEHVELGRQKYLLSPQDLAAFDLIPELMASGVAALKIEGRLKSPEYVASITSQYREAIDIARRGERATRTKQQVEEMELTFSRGFAPGWLEGCDHKRLVPGVSSAKRGLQIGMVEQVREDRVVVKLSRRVQAGDGVMFDCGREQNDQPGGRVFEVWVRGKVTKGGTDRGTVELAFRNGCSWIVDLAPGQTVWKTDDPALTRRLRRSFENADPVRRIPVDMHIQASTGEHLQVKATLPNGEVLCAASAEPLQLARRHSAEESLFREQLGRLGHTPLRLERLTCEIQGAPMVPLSVLGQVRRALTQQILERLEQQPNRKIADRSVLAGLRPRREPTPHRPPAQLHLHCRSLTQLDDALEMGVDYASVDFADIRQYRDAVRVAREQHTRLALATPRIYKPGEQGIFRSLLRHEPDAVLVRNLAGVQFFREHGVPTIADYTLNAANELTAAFIKRQGVDRLTVSYDMNRDQLLQLVAATPPEWLEVVIHQHMPMFHMEHCVFCAVLSPGTDKTNCGRPCDDHTVQLEDRVGMRHRLSADVGCRNTLFNAQPQSAAEVVPQLISNGMGWFRVELLEQSSKQAVQRIISLYRQLLQGELSGRQVWSELRAANRVGVTRGTLEAKRDPLAIL